MLEAGYRFKTQSRWWKQTVQLGGDITKESAKKCNEAQEAHRSQLKCMAKRTSGFCSIHVDDNAPSRRDFVPLTKGAKKTRIGTKKKMRRTRNF